MADDDKKDDLDLIVAHLKATAVTPIILTGASKNKAVAFDHGPDLDFLARLERGEHLTAGFLDAIHHGNRIEPETFAKWQEAASKAAENFRRDVRGGSPDPK